MFRKVGVCLCLALGLLAACGQATDNTTRSRGAATSEALNYGQTATVGTQASGQTAAAGEQTTGNAVATAPANGAASGGQTTGKQYSAPPAMQIDPNKTYTAVIDTTKGKLTAELYPKDAPMAVNNFVFLAREGFYQNIKFHRIIKNFMVQTGDPEGTGRGGPGYDFAEEPVKRPYDKGTIAMARTSQPSSQGSQFFIVSGNEAAGLPKDYTIFGKLTEGVDVLDAIASTPVTTDPNSGEASSPTEDVRIKNITISEQ